MAVSKLEPYERQWTTRAAASIEAQKSRTCERSGEIGRRKLRGRGLERADVELLQPAGARRACAGASPNRRMTTAKSRVRLGSSGPAWLFTKCPTRWHSASIGSGSTTCAPSRSVGLLARAKAFRDEHTRRIDDRDEFYAFFTTEREEEGKPTPIHGGFALTHFSGEVELEKKIKDDLSVTVRCIPLDKSEPGTCPFTGKPSPQRVIWANLTPREQADVLQWTTHENPGWVAHD